MADNLSNDAENKTLDHLTGRTTFTITGPLQLALLLDEPDDDNAGAEVNGGSYARQTISFDAAADGQASNSNSPLFTDLPACTIAGFAIYDSTPQRIWHGPTSRVYEVAAGDELSVEPGTLVLGLS